MKKFVLLMAIVAIGFMMMGCATVTGYPETPSVLAVFSQNVPDEMQGGVIASYTKILSLFADPQAKADYESSLKGLQENKDYYVVIGAGVFTTKVTAIRR
ncbi:hypothetical protein AGMMS50268_14380 [Spirochaetia bacterium]|nr:hypothetical protein AGMMS50268_14380 [Spirochaetia bacterium]